MRKFRNRGIEEIFKTANYLFQTFFKKVNCLFFYEMFDRFEEVNKSCCYQNHFDKPQFGPYHSPQMTLEIMRF